MLYRKARKYIGSITVPFFDNLHVCSMAYVPCHCSALLHNLNLGGLQVGKGFKNLQKWVPGTKLFFLHGDLYSIHLAKLIKNI